jgi:hypothetical protein
VVTVREYARRADHDCRLAALGGAEDQLQLPSTVAVTKSGQTCIVAAEQLACAASTSMSSHVTASGSGFERNSMRERRQR